ncbi:MAG: universal stress protein [Chloroflexota bacterium]|nr:universal stress protein [Chloroflexota bacterium]
MSGTIIVALDGAPLAEQAIPYAESLCKRTEWRLVLVRVRSGQRSPTGTGERLEEESYLRTLAQQLDARGLSVDTAVPQGEPAQCIADEARLQCADVIVMATHARGGIGSWALGSVASEVLARSSVPVLLVRQGTGSPLFGAASPRVIVSLDGTTYAEEALALAESYTRMLGAELVLVRVVSGRDPHGDPVLVTDGTDLRYLESPIDIGWLEAKEYLEHAVARLAAKGVAAVSDTRVGSPAEQIAQAAREHEACLVVMATHGRRGASRVLMGSVAADVLRAVEVPLLLVRPPRAVETSQPQPESQHLA